MKSSRALLCGSRPAFKALACAAAILLLGLVACSGQSNAPSSLPFNYYSSGKAVCALLTERDLEVSLGHRYDPGAGDFNPDFLSFPGINACSYGNAEPKSGVPVVSGAANSILAAFPKVYAGVVYAYARQIFNQHRSILLPPGRPHLGVPIHGIGEEAFWWPTTTQFYVLTRGKMLVLQFQPEVLEARKHILNRGLRLAKRAVGRLR